MEKTVVQLEVERLARISAEAKLAGAMKDLAAIAAVKEEARGVGITLSGPRGVASEKITAVGLGSSRAITDNKTVENRANNLRVEIIIAAS